MQRPLEPQWLNPRYSRDVRERCRQIEAEPLPASTAVLLDEAVADVPERIALEKGTLERLASRFGYADASSRDAIEELLRRRYAD